MDQIGERGVAVWMREQVDEAQQVREAVRKQVDHLAAIATLIAGACVRDQKVLLFGNGGSAASAEHWAAELTGRFRLADRPPISAVALTANTAQLTAIANDFGYEAVFERMIRAHCTEDDIAIGLSTSGTSTNVLRGLKAASRLGAVAIGWTGQTAGQMPDCCDILVQIPSRDTARIQEGHDLCAHLVLAAVERILFGNGR